MTIEIIEGDCLKIMKDIPDESVDMVLCDLPYGTTQNKWDSVLPLDALWAAYWRVCKPNAAVVLTAAQPFTSLLVVSQLGSFRYDWVWRKVRVTGHLNAKKMPLREHESVLVFYRKTPTYNPQMVKGDTHIRGPRGKSAVATTNYGEFLDDSSRQYESDEYYPRSTVEFRSDMQPVHPTQKPVPLFEYLIRTYTDEGQTVLDNTMGSGTTGVACLNTGRNFIGIEQDTGYFDIAARRLGLLDLTEAV